MHIHSSLVIQSSEIIMPISRLQYLLVYLRYVRYFVRLMDSVFPVHLSTLVDIVNSELRTPNYRDV